MAWTAAKRKSVQGYTPGLANPYPTGTIGIQARAAVAWLFAADSYPAPVVPPASTRARRQFVYPNKLHNPYISPAWKIVIHTIKKGSTCLQSSLVKASARPSMASTTG